MQAKWIKLDLNYTTFTHISMLTLVGVYAGELTGEKFEAQFGTHHFDLDIHEDTLLVPQYFGQTVLRY